MGVTSYYGLRVQGVQAGVALVAAAEAAQATPPNLEHKSSAAQPCWHASCHGAHTGRQLRRSHYMSRCMSTCTAVVQPARLCSCSCTAAAPLEGGKAHAVAVGGLVKASRNLLAQVAQDLLVHRLYLPPPLRGGTQAAILHTRPCVGPQTWRLASSHNGA